MVQEEEEREWGKDEVKKGEMEKKEKNSTSSG